MLVVPAFVISELKTAFQMGFVLFIPFLIIDMVVASVLMSMGMMMLPPVLISPAVQDPALRAGGRLVPDRAVPGDEFRIGGREEEGLDRRDADQPGPGRAHDRPRRGGPSARGGPVMGVAISVLQAVTQIQEATLSFVPKILGVAVAFLIFMPWMIQKLVKFTTVLFGDFRVFIR